MNLIQLKLDLCVFEDKNKLKCPNFFEMKRVSKKKGEK